MPSNTPQAIGLPKIPRSVMAVTKTREVKYQYVSPTWERSAFIAGQNNQLKSIVAYNKDANNDLYLHIKNHSFAAIPESVAWPGAESVTDVDDHIILPSNSLLYAITPSVVRVKFTSTAALTGVVAYQSYYIGFKGITVDGPSYYVYYTFEDAFNSIDENHITIGGGLGAGTVTLNVLTWIEYPPIKIDAQSNKSVDFAAGHRFSEGIYIIGSTSDTGYSDPGANLFFDVVTEKENE